MLVLELGPEIAGQLNGINSIPLFVKDEGTGDEQYFIPRGWLQQYQLRWVLHNLVHLADCALACTSQNCTCWRTCSLTARSPRRSGTRSYRRCWARPRMATRS